ARFDTDPSTFAAIFHRIADQVLECALEGRAIGHYHRQIGIYLFVDLKAALFYLQSECCNCILDDACYYDRLKLIRSSVRMPACELEDLLYHLSQSSS